MSKKKFTLILLASLFFVPLCAQSSKEIRAILDQTATTVKEAGNMEINFSASTFFDKKQRGNLTGVLYLKGEKFHIESTSVVNWFDGKKLWSLNKANEEVNVSIPDEKEKQSMNPYLFISMYKEGFSYSMKEVNLRGHDCYEVQLLAKKKKMSNKEMLLTIDKKTHLPLCVRMRQGNGYWVRISILGCKIHQDYADSMFQFKHEDYPNVSVIDLR